VRLFGKVDSTVDRYDRAEWLTVPFDLAFRVRIIKPSVIGRIGSTQTYIGRPENDHWQSVLASHMGQSVDARIAGLNAATAKQHHSFDTLTGDVALNQNFWGADLDFSFHAVGTKVGDSWNKVKRGTAVSNRHCLMHGHAFSSQADADDLVASGLVWKFVSADGTTEVERTVSAILLHPHFYYSGNVVRYDVAVAVLSAKLPDEITPARTLPPHWRQALPPYLEVTPHRLAAVVRFDMEGNGLVFDWGCNVTTLYDGPYTATLEPTDSTRKAFHEELVAGDSGMPCCAIVNDEPLLLSLTTYGGDDGGGYPIFDDHDTINDLMAQLDATYWPNEDAATLQYPSLLEFMPSTRNVFKRTQSAVSAIGRGV